MTKVQIARILAEVNRGLLQRRYDKAAAYMLLRGKLHAAMYGTAEGGGT